MAIDKVAARLHQTNDLSIAVLLSTIVFLLVFSPGQVWAESYPFGRLFTDNAERRVLDQRRRSSQETPEILKDEAIYPAHDISDLPAPARVEFSGYVRRPDGKYTIWVDGKSELSATHIDAISATLSTKQSTAVFRSANQAVTLMPGQTWYPEQNLVTDLYQETSQQSKETSAEMPTNNNSKGVNIETLENLPVNKGRAGPETSLKQAIKSITKAGIIIPVTAPSN